VKLKISKANYQRAQMSYYRTPEHRQLRAELICKWKPWERSTGPKTPAGKARVARNSYKARIVYRRRSDLDPKLVGQWPVGNL
jgi:hypothetical protein